MSGLPADKNMPSGAGDVPDMSLDVNELQMIGFAMGMIGIMLLCRPFFKRSIYSSSSSPWTWTDFWIQCIGAVCIFLSLVVATI